MNIEKTIAIKTLDVIKDSIEGGSKIIQFFDVNDVLLADMPFEELVISSNGEYYIFSSGSISGSFLRGEVIATGIVSKFSIDGLNASSVLTPNILTGTVGTVSSGRDLLCNKINWTIGKVITWSELQLKLRG